MSGKSEIDEALSCSICEKKFTDVIKLIIECGVSICGQCYGDLKEDANEGTSKYQCPACNKEHSLPLNGLPDNKNLLKLLKNYKTPEKAFSEEAKQLRELVRHIEDETARLEAFDAREVIKSHCEKLEQDVIEAVLSAIEHLKELEHRLLNQIKNYHEACLKHLGSEVSSNLSADLVALKSELNKSNARWKNYFTQMEIYERESEIECALVKSTEYQTKLLSLQESMRLEALNGQILILKFNSEFCERYDHVGTIENIAGIFLRGHSERINQAIFLSNDQLASGSDDKTIKVWNVHKGKQLFELTYSEASAIRTIASLPNNRLASGSEDGVIMMLDLYEKTATKIFEAHGDGVLMLHVLKNGTLVSYSLDNTIRIWNLDSQADEQIVMSIGEHGNLKWPFPLFGVLSNDHLVACSREEECLLRVWDSKTGELVKSIPLGLNDASSLFVLSNDLVALGFQVGTIKIIDRTIWDPSRTIEKAHEADIFSLAQFSNGNLVSSGKDDCSFTVKVWRLLDLSLLHTINPGHTGAIRTLSISPNEKFLASGDDKGMIRLFPIKCE